MKDPGRLVGSRRRQLGEDVLAVDLVAVRAAGVLLDGRDEVVELAVGDKTELDAAGTTRDAPGWGPGGCEVQDHAGLAADHPGVMSERDDMAP